MKSKALLIAMTTAMLIGGAGLAQAVDRPDGGPSKQVITGREVAAPAYDRERVVDPALRYRYCHSARGCPKNITR